MPYIPSKDRLRAAETPATPGELTFAITALIDAYLACAPGAINFEKRGDVVLALECAKLEFYRRVLAPYEDRKCKDNGDVYGGGLFI